MFYYNPYYHYPFYLYQSYPYNYFYSPLAQDFINPYYYRNKIIQRPKHIGLYREFSFDYITDWLGDKYDDYKKYLFLCFYKYPYEFENIKKCLQEEYNVPSNIAENITDIAQYGYETVGWSGKKLLLNKLSGEWKTEWGILKLYVTDDLVPTDDVIFPYAYKVTGNYDWNGGGKIEGAINWGGVLSGTFIEPNAQGKFEIVFKEDDSGKKTFRGSFTENLEEHDWSGEQIKEY